ncbi:MAG TPA: hypothetical protein VFF68_03855 [Anaerolineaceae bacterium]|nr:hypothetical protein [Anaerolineaceae bacterium]
MKRKIWLVVWIIPVLLVAACVPGSGMPFAFTPTAVGEEGQVPVTGETPGAVGTAAGTDEGPAGTQTPAAPVPGVDTFLTPLGGELQFLAPEFITALQTMLANTLGISVADIAVSAVEPVQWSDACLEAAFPDETCAQVVTPGFRVMLEANGEVFELRTDASGQNVRLAQGGDQLQEMAIQAQLMLRELLNVDLGQVQISNVERVTFPDACLGIDQPGQACAQVETPGFRITADVMGSRFELRASERDGRLFLLTPDQTGTPEGF